MTDGTPTAEAIEIIEVTHRQQSRDPRTGQTLTREIVTGYLLQRGTQFAGVHLSWSPHQTWLCPFTSREHAIEGLESLIQLGDLDVSIPPSGPVVRRIVVTVPFDVAHSPANHKSISVEVDADCAATLSAVASAMGCSPSEAVAEMLKRVAEAAR